jgi:hypothetical protein
MRELLPIWRRETLLKDGIAGLEIPLGISQNALSRQQAGTSQRSIGAGGSGLLTLTVGYSSGSCSQSRMLPSMSVKRKVTVLVGASDTLWLCPTA